MPGSLSLIFHLKVNGHASNYLLSNYTNGTRFMYKHITHLKTISLDRGSDSIINKSINVARRSMKGLPFYERYAAGARDSEKTFNPDITEVKVIVNGSRIRFTAKEWRQEICEKRSSEDLERKNSAMNATDLCRRQLRSFYRSQEYESQSSSWKWVESDEYERRSSARN